MLQRISYLCFLLGFAFAISAQHKADSLKKAITKTSEDTNRINIYLALTNEYQVSNDETAFVYAGKALELSRKLKFVKGVAHALDDMGGYYNGRGNYVAALKHFTEAMKLFEELGRKRNVAIVANSIGNTYLGIENNSKALEYYQKSHDIAQEIKSMYVTGLADVGISSVYGRMGKHKEALSALNEAAMVFEQLKQIYPQAVVVTNTGGIYSDMGKYDSALYYFDRALVLHKQVGNNYGTYSTLASIGRVYLAQKKYSEALKYLLEAYKMCKAEKAPDNEKDIVKSIAETYKAMGQYLPAYDYYVQYSDLKDSVFNNENNKQLLDVQTRYETEKKDKEIILLSKDMEIQAEALSRTRLIIAFTVGGLLLVASAGIIVFVGYRRKQRMNKLLELQKSIIEEKNKSITDSIRYAKNIQEAILPEVKLLEDSFREYFVFYKPKDIVSGDFYWVVHKKDRVYFAAVDCTGHGVPGAFMSMIGNTLLNDIVNDKQVGIPSEILFNLREGIIKSLKQKGAEGEAKDGMDIALCCLHRSSLLEFAGANNPCWVVRGEDVLEFKGDKQPIGIYSGAAKEYHTHCMQLQPGDTVYVFTDGMADQFGGEQGKKFKYKKLKELFMSIRNLSMREQQRIIAETYEKWRGSLEQVDDILVMGVRV